MKGSTKTRVVRQKKWKNKTGMQHDPAISMPSRAASDLLDVTADDETAWRSVYMLAGLCHPECRGSAEQMRVVLDEAVACLDDVPAHWSCELPSMRDLFDHAVARFAAASGAAAGDDECTAANEQDVYACLDADGFDAVCVPAQYPVWGSGPRPAQDPSSDVLDVDALGVAHDVEQAVCEL
jgi:hypothetical protein